MAKRPLFSIRKNAISGAIWEGKFGPQPSIRKAKRNKKGDYVKDENGKQIYTDFYNENDLLDISYVAYELFRVLNQEIVTADNDDNSNDDTDMPF